MRENPFVLDKIGQCKSILSEAKLQEKIRKALHKSVYLALNAGEGVSAFGYPKGVVKATDAIIQLIEEEMAE